jgi:hypothetical protein
LNGLREWDCAGFASEGNERATVLSFVSTGIIRIAARKHLPLRRMSPKDHNDPDNGVQ